MAKKGYSGRSVEHRANRMGIRTKQIELIREMPLSRKPMEFVDANIIPYFDALDELSVYNGDHLITPFDHLKTKESIYILERDGIKYLVNTEGFDYPRYIARIVKV